MEQQNQQHDEKPLTEYPRGRGYGHDYMRGGEVFGGYGYSQREEYERPRGAKTAEEAGVDIAETEPVADAEGAPGERTGEHADGSLSDANAAAHRDAGPQMPLFEHTYGSTGGNLRHSRSFYVTQAQLQQRIYGPQRYGHGPYHERLRTIVRDDADIEKDVVERLFYDTWVDSQRIAVRVENGIVILSGTLPTYEEIRYACDDAWEVAGVRGVHSDLRIGDAPRNAEGGGKAE